MPISSSDIPKHLTKGLQTLFFREYNKEVNNEWKALATEIKSTGSKETYGWLGSTPGMREWIDERMPAELKEFGFEIQNKKWESSIEVSVDALEDDQYGQIKQRVLQLAESARMFKGEKFTETLVAGATAKCYDGKAFFATTHTEGSSGTQSNKTTNELTAANLQTARATMLRYKDDKGNFLKIVGDTLMVPPELEDTALELVGATTIERYTADGTDKMPTLNVHKGKYNVIVDPLITDADSWYLACTNRVTKPLIFQNRKETTFDALESKSDQGFMTGQYVYGVSNRFNFGYGDWRYCIANIPA